MIGTSSIIFMAITSFVTIITPFALLITWVRKTKTRISPFFVGAAIFIVFALVLESSLHSIVLTRDSIFYQNTFLYVIYGCAAAALFEEGGRFIAFKYFMKKEQDKEVAVTYGIGHAGIEMLMLVGISMLSSIIFAFTVNGTGIDGMIQQMGDESLRESVVAMVTSLQNFGFMNMVMTLLERGSAFILHLSCSVLVFFAVRNKKWNYMGMALLFHALLNVPAALSQKGVLTNIWVVEILIFIIAVVVGYIGYNVYKKEKVEE